MKLLVWMPNVHLFGCVVILILGMGTLRTLRLAMLSLYRVIGLLEKL